MDFSSKVLIDFGLNLAGYVVAALLIYLLLGMRRRRAAQTTRQEGPVSCKIEPKELKERAAPVTTARDLEFVPLKNAGTVGGDPGADKASDKTAEDTADKTPPAVVSRQASRRAIYQEARRLLASGKAHSDLLQQLPLTEGELEMLTLAGKA